MVYIIKVNTGRLAGVINKIKSGNDPVIALITPDSDIGLHLSSIYPTNSLSQYNMGHILSVLPEGQERRIVKEAIKDAMRLTRWES